MKFAPPVKVGGIRTSDPVNLTEPDNAPGSIVFDRSLWFEGTGSPPDPNTIGAKDGDCYIDTVTGNVYRLEL